MAIILFTEDDDTLRENISSILRKEGFEVVACADSTSALRHFETSQVDLALLDITLGEEKEGGYQLCINLRQRSPKLPIIFFTGHESDFDKISGMRLGADDYLTKDINIDYLIVRIRALLRRVEILTGNPRQSTEALKRGDLIIDMESFSVAWKNQPVKLSLTQVWIVHAMANHPGHVRSQQQLMEAAKLTIQPNSLIAHIKNIRSQFLDIDPDFNAIKTERGIGYRWIID